MNYPKLPKQLKNKWIKALRSGKFKQGNGILKRKNYKNDYEYCCLGVLAEISGCKIKTGGTFLESKSISNVSKIPEFMRGSKDRSVPEMLANRNDSGRWSFIRIANWIDKNL